MQKRAKIKNESVIDSFLKTEDVQKILSCSESHVYMLGKTRQIEEIDISCSGRGGPNTKRYSVSSVNALIEERKRASFEKTD